MFIGNLAWPILNGSNSAIWQAKVPPEMQGRVMSVRLWLAQISAPAAMLAAGPLADKVMEPAMAPGGSLVPVFGGLVGSGPGAGMAVIFLVAGVLGSLSGIVGYFIPIIRNVEDLLPDHDLDVETLANERQEQAEDDDTLAAEAPA